MRGVRVTSPRLLLMVRTSQRTFGCTLSIPTHPGPYRLFCIHTEPYTRKVLMSVLECLLCAKHYVQFASFLPLQESQGHSTNSRAQNL